MVSTCTSPHLNYVFHLQGSNICKQTKNNTAVVRLYRCGVAIEQSKMLFLAKVSIYLNQCGYGKGNDAESHDKDKECLITYTVFYPTAYHTW